MIAEPSFYVAAFFVVLLTGVSKSGFGTAGGFAVPVLALTIAPQQAAAIMLPILLIMDAFGLVAFRGKFDRANLRIILPGAVLGIVMGSLTFGSFDQHWIRGLIGVESVVFALDRFRKAAIPIPQRPGTRLQGWFWGTVSGFTSFVSHAGGPPIMQYLLPQGMDKVKLVGTTVIYFSVVNFLKLGPYAALGLLDLGNLTTSTLLLPIVPIGFWLGLKLLHWLDQRRFNLTLTWLLLLTGLKLLWDAVFSG